MAKRMEKFYVSARSRAERAENTDLARSRREPRGNVARPPAFLRDITKGWGSRHVFSLGPPRLCVRPGILRGLCERSGPRASGFQERQQVGEFLLRELIGQSLRHQRYRAGLHLDDVAAWNAGFIAVAGEHDFVGQIVVPQDAAVYLPGARPDDHRFVAAREAGARVEDCFEQVAFAANLANAREVGADAAAHVADG